MTLVWKDHLKADASRRGCRRFVTRWAGQCDDAVSTLVQCEMRDGRGNADAHELWQCCTLVNLKIARWRAELRKWDEAAAGSMWGQD